jgi:hypothetical protein
MHRTSRLRVAFTTAALLVTTLAVPSAAANPPGNNGTIKVDAQVFDTLPDNQPHTGCIFQVDYYGFDEGSLYATATFAVMMPTQDIPVYTDTHFIGEDSNAGGGSVAGIDQQVTYDLNEALYTYDTYPKQGIHLRLTVHADGASNADTKSKTFWATGCRHQDPDN